MISVPEGSPSSPRHTVSAMGGVSQVVPACRQGSDCPHLNSIRAEICCVNDLTLSRCLEPLLWNNCNIPLPSQKPLEISSSFPLGAESQLSRGGTGWVSGEKDPRCDETAVALYRENYPETELGVTNRIEPSAELQPGL